MDPVIHPAADTRSRELRPRLLALLGSHRTGAVLAAALTIVGASFTACSPGLEPTVAAEVAPDLRARIDRLIRDVAAAPTTQDTFVARAEVLWDWTNAFALEGGAVPVNLTTIAGGAARVKERGGRVPPDAMADLDRYVRELALKESDPQAIGPITISPAGPLASRSMVTIEQTYTVGTKPMAVGAVVLVARQLQPDQGRLQNDDPGAEGYLSIHSSRPGATWEPIHVPLVGMHGGFRGAEPMPAFRLAGTALEKGDTVTVVYGDKSGGSPGFQLQTLSTDQLMLPLYLDLDGKGEFLTPRWPSVQVVGGAVEAVSVVAPAVVTPGEEFELRVRSEDRYSNRATGPKPAYQVTLDGKPVTSIAAGDSALVTVSGLYLDRPGVYRYQVRSEDGKIAATANPLWVRPSPSHRIYFGETHAHTAMAEGQGSPGAFWTWARDDARLDFAGLTEHDIWLDDHEWSEMQRLARETAKSGELVPFLAYEWTAARDWGGHHNVLFRTPDHQRVGVQVAPSLPDLYKGLHASVAPEDVLVIPHAHQAGDWTQNDPELEKVVEIYSMHGSFEWFGNMYLKNGFEVGFVAASDDHRSRPGYAIGMRSAPLEQQGGYAAVLAPEKTPDAIFRGLRSLSSYATSGQRILLDASLNGHRMGTRQDDTARREIAARVSGTAPIDQIDVIKNGDVVWSRSYLSAPLAPRSWLQVSFESSSDVLGKRDNPRGYRIWDGWLEVEGARVTAVKPVGLDNVFLEHAELDTTDPARVRFHVETRGRRDGLLLELEGARPTTVIKMHLDASREDGIAPVPVRRPAAIPAVDLTMPLDGLVSGRLERELEVDEHKDYVRLQVVDPDGPLDQSITFVDMDPPVSGDYYYVRVTQLDGGRAWSSPFWVGRQ